MGAWILQAAHAHQSLQSLARLSALAGSVFFVSCADGTCSNCSKLQPEGKKRMTAAEFLRGNPILPARGWADDAKPKTKQSRSRAHASGSNVAPSLRRAAKPSPSFWNWSAMPMRRPAAVRASLRFHAGSQSLHHAGDGHIALADSAGCAHRPLLSKPNARLDPEVRIALRLGALQLLFLDRIPAHAAIGESVALAKSAGHKFASGMVNAVLRKLAALPKPGSAAAVQSLSNPASRSHRASRMDGRALGGELRPGAACAICQHGQNQPELTIRFEDLEAEASCRAGNQPLPGALLTAARRVLSGDVTSTTAFQSGRVRIQEEGSQLIAELAGHGKANPWIAAQLPVARR
jgi:hypothetical protein